MDKRHWKKWIWVAAFALALAMVVNPELRALLYFVDFMGIELVVLLLITQLRSLCLPQRACSIAAFIGHRSLKVLPAAVSLRPFNKLVYPVLFVASYGLACGT